MAKPEQEKSMAKPEAIQSAPEGARSKNVYALIAAVSAALAKEGIAKDQFNQGQKFKFRGIDDLYNALGPIMAREGLVCIPRALSREFEILESTNDSGAKKRTLHTVMLMEYRLVSSHDGSEAIVCMYGEAADAGDKGTSKAASMAYKSAMFQAFCIPVEGTDDADADSHDLANSAPAKKVAAKESKPATISEEEQATIAELIEQSGASREDFLKFFKISGVAEMRVIDYSRAVSLLRAKLANGGN